jgi:hypothetical protein
MGASLKKRLKWYGGIFLIASIVFGVNIFQYEKVKDKYELRKIFKCSKKYFYGLQTVDQDKPKEKPSKYAHIQPQRESIWKKQKPMTMAEQYKQKKLQPNNPRNGLSKSQIAEAEEAYRKCQYKREVALQEAKSKKDRTEFLLGTGAVLMFFTFFIALIDAILLAFKKRRQKIKSGEISLMENKKITKIAILVLIIWGIISFLIAQSGYKHRFKIDTFLILNIPTILFMGYLWIADRLTLK